MRGTVDYLHLGTVRSTVVKTNLFLIKVFQDEQLNVNLNIIFVVIILGLL